MTHGAYKNIKEPGDDEETHDGQENGADTASLARIIEHASGPIKLAVALWLRIHLYHHHVLSSGMSGVDGTER